MATLNERLRSLRTAREILQKDVAKAVCISTIAYQRYEYGERKPTSDILIALADYFDVSLDYLTGRTDNPNSHKL